MRSAKMILFSNTSFFGIILLFFFASCVTAAKMDRHVAKQFNNQIPPPPKKKNNNIVTISSLLNKSEFVSTSLTKTSKVLPLIFYWQWEYRNTCTLNPEIPINSFINTMNSGASKNLIQKLNGQKLELTIEEIPNVFSFVDKAHMIWLIYAISWDKIYIEPNKKELIVSYKILQENNIVKTGKIAVPNPETNRPLRFWQSWKGATSEYVATYNVDIINMTKSFISKLTQEL
jgi:hypothetical protein